MDGTTEYRLPINFFSSVVNSTNGLPMAVSKSSIVTIRNRANGHFLTNVVISHKYNGINTYTQLQTTKLSNFIATNNSTKNNNINLTKLNIRRFIGRGSTHSSSGT